MDRATICWFDKDGTPIEEDIVAYEPPEDYEEEVSQDSSALSYEALRLEAVSIDKLLLVLIMDDTLEKLGILRCTAQRNHPPIPFKFPEYKTIDERFGQVIEYEEDVYSESKKRYSDLTMIYSILYRTLEDLANNGSYSPLGEATRIIKRLHEDEEKLFKDEELSRTAEADYKKRLRTQKKELDAEYKAKLEELRQLELAHENAIAYGKLEHKYLVNWEEARRHQAHVKQERTENNYRDIIMANETQIQLENLIHGEMVRFFEENAEEVNNEISDWMYRYETETESRDAELLKLRMDRDAQLEKYEQLKATYENQKEFIDYWANVKEEQRLEEERVKQQDVAATKIQAWWRGIMVRRHLGQFRIKGKKGKNGAKKGAKKK